MNTELIEFLEGLVHGPCAGVPHKDIVDHCASEATKYLPILKKQATKLAELGYVLEGYFEDMYRPELERMAQPWFKSYGAFFAKALSGKE